MDQCVTRGCVGGLELHGQRPEASLGGAFKSLTVLQQRPVQMEANIRLETLGETFQHLGRGSEGARKQREEGGRRDREVGEKEDRRKKKKVRKSIIYKSWKRGGKRKRRKKKRRDKDSG